MSKLDDITDHDLLQKSLDEAQKAEALVHGLAREVAEAQVHATLAEAYARIASARAVIRTSEAVAIAQVSHRAEHSQGRN